MAQPKDWYPRVVIDITEEQFNSLQKAIPWGLKTKIFNHVVDELLRIHTEFGHIGMALLAKEGVTITLKGGIHNEG